MDNILKDVPVVTEEFYTAQINRILANLNKVEHIKASI